MNSELLLILVKIFVFTTIGALVFVFARKSLIKIIKYVVTGVVVAVIGFVMYTIGKVILGTLRLIRDIILYRFTTGRTVKVKEPRRDCSMNNVYNNNIVREDVPTYNDNIMVHNYNNVTYSKDTVMSDGRNAQELLDRIN